MLNHVIYRCLSSGFSITNNFDIKINRPKRDGHLLVKQYIKFYNLHPKGLRLEAMKKVNKNIM